MDKLIKKTDSLRMQRAVAAEVESILNNIMMESEDGTMSPRQFQRPVAGMEPELTSKVNVFLNRLPVSIGHEDEDDLFFPYCIVRLQGGKTEDDDDYWHVPVNMYFGSFDVGTDSQGDEDIQIMIAAVAERFAAFPAIKRTRYRAEQDMEWVLQDEDTYPYFFGALQITFAVPKAGREDIYTDGFA